MSRSIVFSSVLIGLVSAAPGLRADDVHPESKYGYVVVHAPGEEHTPLSGLSVSFTKKDVGSTPIGEAGKPFKVFAGTGCLSISRGGSESYQVQRCGIQVQEKQTVTINLARVDLTWSSEPMIVNVGSTPSLLLTSQTPMVTLSATPVPAAGARRPSYLLFPGNYQGEYGDIAPLKGHEVAFQLGDLEAKNVDLTPSDMRSDIIVSAEPIHLPSPARNSYYKINEVTVVERNFSQLPEDLYHTYVQRTGARSFVEVSLSAAVQQVHLHAFALSSEQKVTRRYDVAVNNIIKPIELTATQTTQVPLGTLNVFHLDGEKKGFYQVIQQQPSEAAAPDRRQIDWVIYSRLLEGDAVPRFEDQEQPMYGSSPYFNTGTSILVPRGWKYTVSTFAFDELRQFEAQSQYEIDLR